MNQSEYAQSGVNYQAIEPFKQIMKEMGKKTLIFPRGRHVYVESHDHGCVFQYTGTGQPSWSVTQEGLGNKNWIAEWMYQFSGTGSTFYGGIGIDAALMAVNDLIACGAMPVIYTDEVAAGDSEWFQDEKRARDLARGYYAICERVGMALPAGESPSLRYLIKSEPPVNSAPSISGSVTGILYPGQKPIGMKIGKDTAILGVTSSGIHANGISLVIKRALGLKDRFMTRLPNGNTLGEEILIPTECYVELVEALMQYQHDIDIHGFLPGTGGGIAKVAFDKRPFTYRIYSWVNKIPLIFQYMRELGVSLEDCLTTFNWGVGYYIFVHKKDVEKVIEIGGKTDMRYKIYEIGRVEEGDRKVIFEPEGIVLPAPGD